MNQLKYIFMTNESKYSLEHLEKALFRTLSPGFKIEYFTAGQDFNFNNSSDLSWAQWNKLFDALRPFSITIIINKQFLHLLRANSTWAKRRKLYHSEWTCLRVSWLYTVQGQCIALLKVWKALRRNRKQNTDFYLWSEFWEAFHL